MNLDKFMEFDYEFKWSLTKVVMPPKNWISAYPEAEFKVVHPNDYLEFVMPG